jgi:hypothetical protein
MIGPMDHAFDSLEEFRLVFRPRMRKLGVDPETADRILDLWSVNLLEALPGSPERQLWSTRALHPHVGSKRAYVIKDDDFRWIEHCVAAAVGLLTDGGFSALPPLISLWYQYRTKGVDLEPEQANVLRALVSIGDWADVARVVGECPLPADQAGVAKTLDGLLKVNNRQGQSAGIVVTEAGLWRSIGI